MFDYRPIVVFLFATTLCDGMDTPGMVAKPIKNYREVLFYQPRVGQIFVGNINVDHLYVDLPVGAHVDGLPIGQPLVMVVPFWHVATPHGSKSFQHTHPSIEHGFYLV
jgi:hypothetical protein